MPRYFFELRSDHARHIDTEGSELSDLETACMEARDYLSLAGREQIMQSGKPRELTVIVSGERDEILYTASLTFCGAPYPDEPSSSDPIAPPH